MQLLFALFTYFKSLLNSWFRMLSYSSLSSSSSRCLSCIYPSSSSSFFDWLLTCSEDLSSYFHFRELSPSSSSLKSLLSFSWLYPIISINYFFSLFDSSLNLLILLSSFYSSSSYSSDFSFRYYLIWSGSIVGMKFCFSIFLECMNWFLACSNSISRKKITYFNCLDHTLDGFSV